MASKFAIAGLAVIAHGGDIPQGEGLVATALERDPKAGDQLNELGFMGYVGQRLAARGNDLGREHVELLAVAGREHHLGALLR